MSDELTDLTISDLEDVQLEVVIGGISTYQMLALRKGAGDKVAAAGHTLRAVAEENPEAVKETFIRNREAFKIYQMPDDLLELLDLKVRGGRLYEKAEEGDNWTEVTIDE